MAELKLRCHLDSLMKSKGLTATKLAEDAQVTVRAVSGLRRNAFVLLDGRTTARICRALGVGPGDLFTVVEEDT